MGVDKLHSAKIGLSLPKKSMASLKKYLKRKGFVPAKLSRTQTDHFEVSAILNGVKGSFILDTGASNTCVGLDKAERFGLVSEPSDIKAAGAGSSEMEARISRENSLRIGHWKKQKMPVVLLDLSHVNFALTSRESKAVDGIIGADVLRKAHAVIDYKKKMLYLKKGSGKK
jgi:predicted aspartyl protease